MTNEQAGFNRRGFLGIAAAGAATFLEACGKLTEEEIKSLPPIALAELAKNAEKFLGLKNIRTSGYVADTGKEVSQESYKMPANRYQWHEYEGVWTRHLYEVSEKPDMSGVKLDAVSEEKLVDYNIDGMGQLLDKSTSTGANVLDREFPKPIAGKKLEIIGRIIQFTDKNTGQKKYVLEIGRLLSEESEQK